MTSNVVVSMFSPVCVASAALRHRVHRTLVTNDGDSALSPVRNTPDSNVEANSGAGWCLSPSEQALNARQLECRHSPLGEVCTVPTQLEISQRNVREIRRTIDR
jgi:hypothetical protein